jgi:two-component system CAI-1 autoinducer sensor kinase/phosphatase CqsS
MREPFGKRLIQLNTYADILLIGREPADHVVLTRLNEHAP